jgi:hypothetical protein
VNAPGIVIRRAAPRDGAALARFAALEWSPGRRSVATDTA